MNKDNRVGKKQNNKNQTKPTKKPISLLMTIRIFVNIYCFKMVCSPLPLPHPSAQPEVPHTLPETKLPKPRGQKGHTFASPLP